MNTRVIWRPYVDYEAEERWLNEMAAQGWEMERYSWCRYVFERGESGRYTYRLQFLPKSASAAESREYLAFLEDAGMEVVATYSRWVYVRKLVDGQPFELFSDHESRVSHHKQVATTLGVVAASQIPLLAVNVQNVAAHVADSAYMTVPLLLLHTLMVGAIGVVAGRQIQTVRRLEQEAIAQE